MITRKISDKWSLIKWIWFSKHSDPKKSGKENHSLLYKAIPGLKRFKSGCGYCEYSLFTDFCPLAEVYGDHTCYDRFDCVPSYGKWKYNHTKRNAKKVLSDIRKAIKIREPK